MNEKEDLTIKYSVKDYEVGEIRCKICKLQLEDDDLNNDIDEVDYLDNLLLHDRLFINGWLCPSCR